MYQAPGRLRLYSAKSHRTWDIEWPKCYVKISRRPYLFRLLFL